jgi:hypothetical protein
MNLKELLNGVKDVIIEALTSGTSTEDILASLNEAWPIHVEKIETIVEAISNERASDFVEEAKAKYTEELKEKFDATTKTLGERVETYLGESYEQFVKEYKASIVSEAKVNLVENFVGKLKQTFNENSIEVDMDAKSNIDQLAGRADELKSKLDESMTEVMSLKTQLRKKEFQLAFESVKSEQGLSETQALRLSKMVDTTQLNESTDTSKVKAKLEFMVQTLIKESKEEDGAKFTGTKSRLDGVLNEDGVNAPSTDQENTPAKTANLADGHLLEGLFV